MEDQIFIVILNTDGEPDYANPQDINARSKNEAYNIFAKDVPPETISGVYTVQEYQQILTKLRGGKSSQSVSAEVATQIPVDNVDESGKNFLQNSIQDAMKAAKKEEQLTNPINATQQVSNIQPTSQVIMQQSVQQKQNHVQYFMDDGIQFKIENGILYKKVWETVKTEEYQNNDGQVVKPEFQIIVKDTGKKLNSTKYAVQQLIWKPVQAQPPTNMIP